jgi:hypothetical protein
MEERLIAMAIIAVRGQRRGTGLKRDDDLSINHLDGPTDGCNHRDTLYNGYKSEAIS